MNWSSEFPFYQLFNKQLGPIILFFLLHRVLCVDAIIDSGDSNSDWRLDFDEYKALMDSSFQPKEKCSN
jgi:hypothetical protein